MSTSVYSGPRFRLVAETKTKNIIMYFSMQGTFEHMTMRGTWNQPASHETS